MATNQYGVAQQSTYVYVMPEGTTIISTPGGRDVILNQTIVITCDARSMTQMDLTFYWRFNNEILTIDNKRFDKIIPIVLVIYVLYKHNIVMLDDIHVLHKQQLMNKHHLIN